MKTVTSQDWDKYNWEAVEEVRGSMRMEKILKYIPRDGVHLDIGTGRGDGTAVAGSIKPTVGLDYGARSLNIARKKNKLLIRGTACTLPFDKCSFNSITCLDVLEHIPDAETAMKEIFRVLTPGGIFILQTPSIETTRIKLVGIYMYRGWGQASLFLNTLYGKARAVGGKIKRKILGNEQAVNQTEASFDQTPMEPPAPQPYDVELPMAEIMRLIQSTGFILMKKKYIRYWANIPIIRIVSVSDLFLLQK